MRGAQLPEILVAFAGVYGDRLFAFKSSATPVGFPHLTGREAHEMLLYRPRFRHPDKAAKPANLAETEEILLILNPVGGDPAELALDVETPSGEVLAVYDPALLQQLSELAGEAHSLTLLRSERAMTDCLQICLFSLQTARQLGEEVGTALDKRRFRANVYLDLTAGGFSENTLVDHKVRIGAKAVIAVLERDPRCQMITLDPETGESRPKLLRQVAQAHDGKAGVYAAVLVEGLLRKGDTVQLLS